MLTCFVDQTTGRSSTWQSWHFWLARGFNAGAEVADANLHKARLHIPSAIQEEAKRVAESKIAEPTPPPAPVEEEMPLADYSRDEDTFEGWNVGGV